MIPLREPLTIERARELFVYSPITGDMWWNVDRAKVKTGDIAGNMRWDGYLRVMVDYVEYSVHRMAWFLVTGSWPEHEIDHIDGIRTNNAWLNLRDVPHVLNQQNQRRPQRNNTTGKLGVSMVGSRFAARIQVKGRSIHIGTFTTVDEAHTAYVNVKRKIHAGSTL